MTGCIPGAMLKVLGSTIWGIPSRNWACRQFRVSAGQVEQERPGQQIGWAYQQSLNLHLKKDSNFQRFPIFVIASVISFPFSLKQPLNFEIIIMPQLLQQTYCTAQTISRPDC